MGICFLCKAKGSFDWFISRRNWPPGRSRVHCPFATIQLFAVESLACLDCLLCRVFWSSCFFLIVGGWACLPHVPKITQVGMYCDGARVPGCGFLLGLGRVFPPERNWQVHVRKYSTWLQHASIWRNIEMSSDRTVQQFLLFPIWFTHIRWVQMPLQNAWHNLLILNVTGRLRWECMQVGCRISCRNVQLCFFWCDCRSHLT